MPPGGQGKKKKKMAEEKAVDMEGVAGGQLCPQCIMCQGSPASRCFPKLGLRPSASLTKGLQQRERDGLEPRVQSECSGKDFKS